MRREKTDLGLKNGLDAFISEIQRNLRSKGFDISKSEVTGFTIDLIRNEFDEIEVGIRERLGNPIQIAEQLLADNNGAWPVNKWYPSEIKLNEFKSINMQRSSLIMKIVLYLHILFAVFGSIAGVLILQQLVFGIYRTNMTSLRIYASLSYLIYYPFFIIALYAMTSRISKNISLRIGVADMHTWKRRIIISSKIHFYSFLILGTYMIAGSLMRNSKVSEAIRYRTPANGIEFNIMIPFVFVSLYIFNLGLKILDNHVDGAHLREDSKKVYKQLSYLLLTLFKLVYHILILGILVLTMLVFRFAIEVVQEDYTDVSELEIPMIFGFLVFVLLNSIFILILKRKNLGQMRRSFKNSIQRSNLAITVLWITYDIIYATIMTKTYLAFTIEPNLFRFWLSTGLLFMAPITIIFYLVGLWGIRKLTREENHEEVQYERA